MSRPRTRLPWLVPLWAGGRPVRSDYAALIHERTEQAPPLSPEKRAILRTLLTPPPART